MLIGPYTLLVVLFAVAHLASSAPFFDYLYDDGWHDDYSEEAEAHYDDALPIVNKLLVYISGKESPIIYIPGGTPSGSNIQTIANTSPLTSPSTSITSSTTTTISTTPGPTTP